MRYFIITFGCQMNVSDSERIAGFLESQNLRTAASLDQAGLAIFNTCGVRQSAEDRVYGQIHNIRKKNPKIKIILTGCLANRKDVQRKLKSKVDLFFPINDFDKLKNWIIDNCLKIENCDLKIPARLNNTRQVQASSPEPHISAKTDISPRIASKSMFPPENQGSIGTIEPAWIPARLNNTACDNYLSINPKYTNNHRAFVPIMTGCNNFCSYCVVPYARGREISRPADEILKEIRNLIKKGYIEIVLLGQNVNSYIHYSPSPSGRGCPVLGTGEGTNHDKINFPKLLSLIEKIPGHFWISFVSSHPKDFSDELIEAIARSKKICEYVHLPIQAGDNKILEKMNRKYTAKHYLKLVARIKSAFKKYKPNVLYSITSDIIVGFPEETKKQFLESANIMKKVKYDMVYFGQFSPRPGTAAAKMKDNISKTEKERRENYLNEILRKTIYASNKKYVGKSMEVLIDKKVTFQDTGCPIGHPVSKPVSKPSFVYFGRTRTMKNVKILSSKKSLVGKLIEVKITKANTWNLEAETTK